MDVIPFPQEGYARWSYQGLWGLYQELLRAKKDNASARTELPKVRRYLLSKSLEERIAYHNGIRNGISQATYRKHCLPELRDPQHSPSLVLQERPSF